MERKKLPNKNQTMSTFDYLQILINLQFIPIIF